MTRTSRRTRLTAGTLLAAAALLAASAAPGLAAEEPLPASTPPAAATQEGADAPTPAPAPETGGDSATDPTADAATGLSAADSGVLSILSTTDVHGHVLNWDYFRDAAPAPQKAYGLSRLATAVQDIREQRGTSSVLLLDNGDAIQGTPLTYLAAQQPEKLTGGDTHPMARAFNLMDYDVQNLGNHEFNYGLDTLAAYENQLEAPLLGANVVKAGTQDPAFEPYTILDRTVAGHPVKVGVLGLVTPGIRIWDKAHVEGKLEFRDPTSTAAEYVPQMKQQGADIVVILAHTGLGVDSEWLPEQLQENTAQFLTTMVDGVDVVIGGHTHKDIPSRVTHSPDGSPVLFTQPNYWAQSLSDVQLPLTFDEGGTASVAWPSSDDTAAGNATIATWATSHPAPPLTDSDLITQDQLLATDHEDTRTYVNTVVAQSSETMSAASSRYEDTPILDFIGAVMVDTVRQGIAGTPAGDLPVIAQVSPFSRDAVFTKGDVTIKDVAGLYIYDNTLMGVQITGAQLRDYMEFSAKYFVGVDEGATFDPETGTNAEWNGSTIPDYNYDALTGVDYRINISKPVGQRIEGLSYNGVPVADGDRFVLAINNYRQSGGGGFPHVTEAPVVYNELVEIRQQMIEYAQAKKVIDPADFFVENWKLTTTEEVGPTPGPSEQPTPGPTPTPSQGAADGGTSASHPADLAHTGADTARVLGVVALLLLIGGLGIALKHRSR